MDLSGVVVLSVLVYLTSLSVLNELVIAIEPYQCYGTVCNRNKTEEFCQSDFPLCRPCAGIKDDCETSHFPQNCTRYCVDHLVKQALDKDAGKNCPEIPALQNGTYDTRGAHKHGDVVVATCDPGFTLIGHNTLTCVKHGQWDNTLPICKEKTCPEIQALENGSYDTRGPHKPGDVVIATCDPGFTLIGHSTLTCAKHGQWDNTPPTCKEKDCPEIPSLENGTYDIRGPHTHGDVVVATCHPGYKLLGHSKLICGKYGRWDNIPPTCKEKDCPEIPAVENGTFDTRGPHKHGDMVVATCDPGFTLIGHSTLTCGKYGQWDNTPPTCKALSCPSPPQLMNGQWEFDQVDGSRMEYFHVNTHAEFVCPTGYHMAGNSSWICSSNGTWREVKTGINHPFPSCTETSSTLLFILAVIVLSLILGGIIIKHIVEFARQKCLKQKTTIASPDVESQIEIPLLGIKTEQAPVEMELKEMVTKHPVSQQDTAVQTEGTWTENNNQDGQGTSEPNTNDLTDSSASQGAVSVVNYLTVKIETREEKKDKMVPDDTSSKKVADVCSEPIQETVDTSSKGKLMQLSDEIIPEAPTLQVIPSAPSKSEVFG
ncbi:P-selectin-like [Mya arenaria]|uniref:P-selectin-like n=1 Tax=Mya arenaria TaxID=6604 RepID=UPI0022E42445|nr:P-selectin-like [Mya arenaria]